MKRLSYCALIIALMSAPAFAAKNSQTVILPSGVTVGSTPLPAGEYKVTWDDTGSAVQVTLQQKGVPHPASATAAAKLVEVKHDHPGYTTGSKSTLETIQFSKFDLVFTPQSARGE